MPGGAADAIARGDDIGSLEPGKRADIVILGVPRHEEVAYRLGDNLVRHVVKDGLPVVQAMLDVAAGRTRGRRP